MVEHPAAHKVRHASVWDIVYVAVVAEVVLWLDLTAKYLVRRQLMVGEAVDFTANEQGFVMLVHLPNSGISLGLFRDYNLAFTMFGIFAALVILTFDLAQNRRVDLGRFGLALLLGGILGNLIDRIALGYVTDIFMLAALPVFNIADVCIAFGVAYLIIDLVRKERHKT
jgi:signal peptidase II